MYQQISFDGQLLTNQIKKIAEDKVLYINLDVESEEKNEYLEWLGLGNEPLSANEADS